MAVNVQVIHLEKSIVNSTKVTKSGGYDATNILTYYAYTSAGHDISLEDFIADRAKAN